jgi:hypothetical protein
MSTTHLTKHERVGGALTPDRPPHAEPMTCTVKDASRISGLGVSTIWKLVAEGKLDTVRVYNRRLVVLASLRQVLTPP